MEQSDVSRNIFPLLTCLAVIHNKWVGIEKTTFQYGILKLLLYFGSDDTQVEIEVDKIKTIQVLEAGFFFR